MEKILVTTDLSANSKAGLRFAIQLAAQSNYQLTFFHVYRVLRPTKWSDAVYTSFENTVQAKVELEFQKFVSSVYRQCGLSAVELDCVAQKGVSSASDIMRYAKENGYNYICTSKSGTGRTLALFGSTISALIKKSDVPVIAVPKNYKRKRLESVTYVSDLMDVKNEMKKVAGFAKPIHAKVELLHFKVPMDDLIHSEHFEDITRMLEEYNITTHFDVLNYEETLINNMRKIFKQTKPSMVIMFSKQKRSFFEKLFLSSISAEYALTSTIPVLVFKKAAEQA